MAYSQQWWKAQLHLDYSIHPKIGLLRKYNIIIYLNSNWKAEWGGELGLWDNKIKDHHGELITSIVPKFNRAIIFDTADNSWHGLVNEVNSNENIARKSIAIYYLCEPKNTTDNKG